MSGEAAGPPEAAGGRLCVAPTYAPSSSSGYGSQQGDTASQQGDTGVGDRPMPPAVPSSSGGSPGETRHSKRRSSRSGSSSCSSGGGSAGSIGSLASVLRASQPDPDHEPAGYVRSPATARRQQNDDTPVAGAAAAAAAAATTAAPTPRPPTLGSAAADARTIFELGGGKPVPVVAVSVGTDDMQAAPPVSAELADLSMGFPRGVTLVGSSSMATPLLQLVFFQQRMFNYDGLPTYRSMSPGGPPYHCLFIRFNSSLDAWEVCDRIINPARIYAFAGGRDALRTAHPGGWFFCPEPVLEDADTAATLAPADLAAQAERSRPHYQAGVSLATLMGAETVDGILAAADLAYMLPAHTDRGVVKKLFRSFERRFPSESPVGIFCVRKSQSEPNALSIDIQKANGKTAHHLVSFTAKGLRFMGVHYACLHHLIEHHRIVPVDQKDGTYTPLSFCVKLKTTTNDC